MGNAGFARRAAAVAYVAWALATLTHAVSAFEIAIELPQPMAIVIGRVAQLAWLLFSAAIVVTWAALTRLWQGEASGFWICLLVSAPVAIGQGTLVVLPGYLRGMAAIAEIAVWCLAVALSVRSLQTDSASPR